MFVAKQKHHLSRSNPARGRGGERERKQRPDDKYEERRSRLLNMVGARNCKDKVRNIKYLLQ